VASESPFPPPPNIEVTVVRDHTAQARATGGFLNLRRLELVATYPGGKKSAPFAYDMCDREAMDAVIVVAHFEQSGERHVFLRSAVRPPVSLRDALVSGHALPDLVSGHALPDAAGGMWEVVAGLIDPGETPAEAGARELHEELGILAHARDLRELGPWTYPAPGIIGERHVFFHVEVDPRSRSKPTEDGSALEKDAAIISVPLAAALRLAGKGLLRDAKTELALRRLAEHA
jgi:ADP-ribose pyrophosphatase